MIVPACANRAPCTTDRPTPPKPTTSTLWPARTFAVLSTAPTPVITAQPTSAACSSGTPSGTGITARSDTTVSSAKPAVDSPGKTSCPSYVAYGAAAASDERSQSHGSACVQNHH